MKNSIMIFIFFTVFDQKYAFLGGEICSKKAKLLVQAEIQNKVNVNMENSIMIFIFTLLD